MADEHQTSTTYDASGTRVTSKSIQGRALDPDAALSVSEKMKSTDLGALARAAAAKRAAASASTQQKALKPEPEGAKK